MIPLEIPPQKGHGIALSAPAIILRLPAVLKARGLSRSTHYSDILQGFFTHPVSIGFRSVGWPEHEVTALNAARIASRSDEQIRALVINLEAARKLVA